MKKFKILWSLGVFLIFTATLWGALLNQAEGAVPQFINFQGILRNPGGTPVTDSTYMLTFRIWDQADPGGNVVWVSVSTPVTTSNGLFNTILLAPGTAFTSDQRWLGVTIDKLPPEPELSPRVQLASVGYSYRVGSVDGATGGDIFGDLTLHSTLTVGDLAGEVGQINVTDGVANTITADGAAGKLSATSTGAGDRLAIEGTANASGTSTAIAVRGTAENSGSWLAIGGSFSTTAAGTGNHAGVQGSADGSGLFAVGVDGIAGNSGAGSATGGNFNTFSSGTGTHHGVMASGRGGSLTFGVDAFGENTGTGDAYGGDFLAGGSGGTGRRFGIKAETQANGGLNIANYDTANGVTAASTYGTYSVAHNSSTGDAYGGFFKTTATGTGNHFGLHSEVFASGGTASSYGLLAVNNATTASIHYGLVSNATGVGPVQNRGVTGFASGATGLNIGIRGDASGTGAYAGSFENAKVRVGATGTENIVDGNGDLYVQDEIEVDGIAAFATDVGVGTTSPSSRLHVREDIDGVAALVIDNQSAGTGSQERIEFRSEDGVIGAAAIAVFDNSSPSAPATMRFANNLTGGSFDFITVGAIRMVIENGGDVGIGTSTPVNQLDVEGGAAIGATFSGTNAAPANGLLVEGNVAIGSTVAEAQLDVVQSGAQVVNVNRNTTDGILINFEQDDIFVGDISVAGAIVSYNAFTGSHYGWTDEAIERGELVSLTGLNRNSYDNPKSEIIYGIKRSTVANDPACLGSYLALQEPSQPANSENPHLIMAVGNGDMWVTDEGGDIQPGDFLISSSAPGHAMKDDPEKYPLGYVIARAAEPVNWGSESETVGGQKHKRISVLFESFVRTSTAHLSKVVEQQQREIEELKALMKTLTADQPLSKKQFGELKKGVDK